MKLSQWAKKKNIHYRTAWEHYRCGKIPGVTLSKIDGQWYATLVVEIEKKKPIADLSKMVGVDLGIKNLFTSSTGHFFGQFSENLKKQVDKADAKRRRKQKLNACLKKKGKPEVDLSSPKIIATVRNEIGRAANQLVKTLEKDSLVVLEKLNIKGMKFKSKRMNSILKASKIGLALDKLKEKLDYKHIRYASVPAAYSRWDLYSSIGFATMAEKATWHKHLEN